MTSTHLNRIGRAINEYRAKGYVSAYEAAGMLGLDPPSFKSIFKPDLVLRSGKQSAGLYLKTKSRRLRNDLPNLPSFRPRLSESAILHRLLQCRQLSIARFLFLRRPGTGVRGVGEVVSEAKHQENIFYWAALNEKAYPELKWLHSIPNAPKLGHTLDKKTRVIRGAQMNREGRKKGVSDIFLPVRRHPFQECI